MPGQSLLLLLLTVYEVLSFCFFNRAVVKKVISPLWDQLQFAFALNGFPLRYKIINKRTFLSFFCHLRLNFFFCIIVHTQRQFLSAYMFTLGFKVTLSLAADSQNRVHMYIMLPFGRTGLL